LKKRTKKLLFLVVSHLPGHGLDLSASAIPEVFWFLSSDKNILALSGAPARNCLKKQHGVVQKQAKRSGWARPRPGEAVRHRGRRRIANLLGNNV